METQVDVKKRVCEICCEKEAMFLHERDERKAIFECKFCNSQFAADK